MASEIRTKTKSFGIAGINHFTPSGFVDAAPKNVSVVLSFEEALKLHLGIGQALAKLNSYNRSTVAGRDSAVCLNLWTGHMRVSVTEARVKNPKKGPGKQEAEVAE